MSAVLFLPSSYPLRADDNATGQRQALKWQTFSADMSPGEYRHAVRQNQKQVRDFVKNYSSEALASVGVPKAGIALLGAAAGLAVDGDARLHLNQSKTLALRFDDVVDDDRALLFTLRKTW